MRCNCGNELTKSEKNGIVFYKCLRCGKEYVEKNGKFFPPLGESENEQ